MMYVIVGVLCGVIGFCVGILVCKNNYRTITEKMAELEHKVEAVREATK